MDRFAQGPADFDYGIVGFRADVRRLWHASKRLRDALRIVRSVVLWEDRLKTLAILVVHADSGQELAADVSSA